MLRCLRKLFFFLPVLFISFSTLGKSLENYEYDATGNIVSIKQSDQSLAIYSFSPTFGPVGAIVTIHGNLFSGVPEQNAVSFNGTPASILSATESVLIVRVPQGATTGLVSVTVQGNTAYSGNDFMVTEDGGGPVIYDFLPKCGAAGTTVTVRGDGFDLTEGATLAGVNENQETANVSNIGELGFSIPANASTGRIRVTTPLGEANSSDILMIPPSGSGLACADTTLARSFLSIGDTFLISYEANQKHVVFFEAEESDLLTLQFAKKSTSPGNTYLIFYRIYDPYGALVLSSSFSSETKTIHLSQLTVSGIYTVVFSANQNNPASFWLGLTYDQLISADAEAIEFSTTVAEQTYRIGFYAEEGQSFGFSLSQMAYGNSAYANQATMMKVFGPDGKVYSSNNAIATNVSCYLYRGMMCDINLPVIKQTGTYTIIVTPYVSTTLQAKANLFSNVESFLNFGQPLPLNLNKIGQDAWLSFEGIVNQSADLTLTNIQQSDQESTHAFITVYVLKPSGTLHKSISIRGASGQLALGVLPETGTYRILISPSYGSRAAMTLTLN